jgi:chromosome segregation ATPase
MSDELTTRPMLEALLEGQRQLASQMTEMRAQMTEMRAQMTEMRSDIAAVAQKQDELAAKQDELAAKQDELAARQERLEAHVAALTREVRDGLDDQNRKLDVFHDRLLSFEVMIRRLDERLHNEILARTR